MRFKAITWALVLLGSHAITQAPYVQQYYATDLSLAPGEIRVSPGYTTHIEFYNTANVIVTGQQSDLITIDDLGSRIVLTTNQRSGSTDLVFEVEGRTLLFELVIDVEDARSRRYPIERQRSRAYAPARPIPPTAQATPDGALAPPTSSPSAAPAEPDTPRNTSDGAGGTVTFIPSGFDGDGAFIAFFTYTNTSSNRIALDPGRVSATQNNSDKPLTLSKQPLRNLVAPGETQNGLITLSHITPGDPIEITWEVVILDPDGGRRTTLGGTLDAN